jgi:hypothetical protein
MAVLDVKVEIGLEEAEAASISFTLDSPNKGVLDGLEFRLGGVRFYDITDRVQSLSTRRGKSQALDRTDSGISSIEFNNSDRLFDPLFPDSPFYLFLVPRREVRISSGTYPVFYGFIDDLDFSYSPGSLSTVRVDVSDGFSTLANAQLAETFPDSELSGARIERVLDLPEVSWPAAARAIESGQSIMLDNEIEEGTGVLDYLQLVTQSEFGNIFIGKAGDLVFKDRAAAQTPKNVTLSDDLTPAPGIKIPYTAINTIYGSENLYNRIVIANDDVVPEEVTLEDADSQQLYGVRTFTQTNLLTEDPADIEAIAGGLLENYKDPQYRFESMVINIDTLSNAETNALLDLEIGDVVLTKFTPNDIPPAIVFAAKIIGISHNWEPVNKTVTLSLETFKYGIFILDNPTFGLLDTGSVS